MVGFKAASMAVLLGSAVLSSAAAVPKRDEINTHPQGKRLWRGRLGARGPWRDENVKRAGTEQDHYLINIDLSDDGPHQNGIGDLIDINTREEHSRGLLDTPATSKGSDKNKDLLKWHLGANGKGGKGKRSVPTTAGDYSLVDIGASINAALQQQGKRGFVDLTAQLSLLNPSKREWEEFESLASSLGVQQDDIAAAKQAASDNLTAELQKDVINAVKKAVWDSQHFPKRGAVPGPALLFRARDVEEEASKEKEEDRDAVRQLLNVDAKIKVLGDAPAGETGVMSTDSGTKHGVPLVVAGAKRDKMEDAMEGAPGYIDITSPVFDSSAQRIASLVLSTANDSSSNSSFVLNASSNIRTQVYLVPIKTDAKVTPGSAAPGAKGDLIKVNLKVPVFVADTATVEPYCATFDPAPEAPSPMTVEPCEDVSNDMPASEETKPEVASADGGAKLGDKSQVFLFDPETGVVKPDWGGAASAQSVPEKEDEQQTSSVAPPTFTSSGLSSSSSVPAVPTSSAAFAAKAAETSSLSSITNSVPTSVAPSAPTTPTTPSSPASSTPVQAYPSETSSIPELPKISSAAPQIMAAPSSYVHTASAPASMIPSTASSMLGSAPTSAVPLPVQPSISASASHAASSVVSSAPIPSASAPAPLAAPSKSADVNAAAASSAPAAPAHSAPAAVPANQGNNVTLIFSPSQASVLSKDKDMDAKAVNLTPDAPASAASVPAEDASNETADAEGDVEAASAPLDSEYDAESVDDEAEDEDADSLNSEEGSDLVARAHKQDDCEDADSYSVKAASTKPKAKLPEGQENEDQGATKKISLGKGGIAVEDAHKLKEETGSKADKVKAEKAKAQSQAKPAGAQGKLGARFLRRQQTVLQAKNVDPTAPYQ